MKGGNVYQKAKFDGVASHYDENMKNKKFGCKQTAYGPTCI